MCIDKLVRGKCNNLEVLSLNVMDIYHWFPLPRMCITYKKISIKLFGESSNVRKDKASVLHLGYHLNIKF